MSDKVQRFLDERRPATPCLVVDLDVVEGKYRSLTGSLPLAEVFYAVKANPAQEVLSRLASLGASFDTASAGEIAQVLSLGVKQTLQGVDTFPKRRRGFGFARQ